MKLTDEQRKQRTRLKAWMKLEGIKRESLAKRIGYKKEYLSLDVSLRYYHAEKIIPEVRDAHLPFLEDALAKQKERLKNIRSYG